MCSRILTVSCLLLSLFAVAVPARAAQLLVGTASVDITPAEPVALDGGFPLRIAKKVQTPVTANVVALESRGEQDRALDTAIMVSCDLLGVPCEVIEQVREEVHKRVPALDVTKIFLNATHTHDAPVLLLDRYPIVGKNGVIQVEAYRALFSQRVADAIAQAWNDRQPGAVTWGLSDALVACNRRAVYADGDAKMYGPTNVGEFRHLEGYEDHDLNTLFFWNAAGELTAVVVNVSCPSQEVEGLSAVNADFWHPIREALRKTYGPKLCVLGWTGAAGDLSPHLMYRKAADERMRQLRGLSRLDEITRRIVRAVNEAYEVVQKDRHADVPLVHRVKKVALPMRLVTEAEYAEAKKACEQAEEQMKKDPSSVARVFRLRKWNGLTVERFEAQKTRPKPTYEVELHVLRIGDVAVCTNPFELFTDYGIRIKARSPAVQTLVVQLAGPGTYLPTERAVQGGHYSALVHSNLVGPEGGQLLVDRTVEMIKALWAQPGK